jgi:hypothetical protein
MIVCAAPLLNCQHVDEVTEQFVASRTHPQGYMVYVFSLSERVESDNVAVVNGSFKMKELAYDKCTIKIYCKSTEDIFFMEGLMSHMQALKLIMGEIEPLTIIQHLETNIEEGYRTVFYSDSTSLFKRIYRSYLYDKIREKWIVEGMVNYNRANKHFQDVSKELIDLMTEGEELVPLQDDTFCFDKVWRLKAIFFYHILSNFKSLRDYGSSSLANLII